MAFILRISLLILPLFSVLVLQQSLTSAEVVVIELNAHYFECSPDGVKKQVLGVNGEFPAPTIRAKLNDTLVIRVTNSIIDQDGETHPTSVHWHGIEQFLTPWHDGPEGVTQCPIPYGSSMEYRFRLYQSGTYWYHSHHNWQYVDGFWGLLIVDNLSEVYQYDNELLVSLNDWHHNPAKFLAEEYIESRITTPIPDTGLVNGRGSYPCAIAIQRGFECDTTFQSPSLLTVTPGKIYRIRVINTSARANFDFSIDGHRLHTIEVDGVDTIAVEPVDVVTIWPAQRYSFLVTMGGNLDAYWIRASMSVKSQEAEQPRAVLQYNRENCVSESEGSSISAVIGSDAGGNQGRPETHGVDWAQIMAHINNSAFQPSMFAEASQLGEGIVFPLLTPVIDVSKGKAADMKHMLSMQSVMLPTTEQTTDPVILDQSLCRPRRSRGAASAPDYYDELVTLTAELGDTNGIREGRVNGVVYKPSQPPVIIRMMKNEPINPSSVPIRIPLLKRVIQLVINSRNVAAHPWHLHGHTFWVLGSGEAGTVGNPNIFDEERDANKLSINGVRRDTTPTAPWSWVVVRFETDNPGAWLLHCHINWHLEIGLGAVFVEGEEELRTLYTLPPEARRVCLENGVEL